MAQFYEVLLSAVANIHWKRQTSQAHMIIEASSIATAMKQKTTAPLCCKASKSHASWYQFPR